MKEKLVEKLFHSTCTEEELETLFELIRKDPAPPDQHVIEKLWEEVQEYPRLKVVVFSRIFAKSLSKIDAVEKAPAPATFKGAKTTYDRVRKRKLLNWAYIAAGILILIVASFWLFTKNNMPATIQTAFGERQSLQLSDGSKVQLNANSQIVFEEKWMENDKRAVWLKGEAFFEEERKMKPEQKFQVITNDLIVEVLGTTFNVNSNDGKTSVYLEEGQVRLYLNGLDSTLLMEPGDLIVYSEQNRRINRKRKEQGGFTYILERRRPDFQRFFLKRSASKNRKHLRRNI